MQMMGEMEPKTMRPKPKEKDVDKEKINSFPRPPVVAVIMDMARHSFKGKLPDGREPITQKGIEEAVKVGAKRKITDENPSRKKSLAGEAVEIYGSPRERTQQSSLFRQFGDLFKEVTFEGVDPQDVLRWLEEGGAVKAKGSELLDFQVGEGEFQDEMMESFGKGELMKWMVEDSDRVAAETWQHPDKATPLSIEAGNVATLVSLLGSVKSMEALKNEKSLAVKNGIRVEEVFATSHQSVLESFLYKVIKMKDEDPEAASRFISQDLDNKGFSENGGFKLGYLVYDKDDISNFQVQIEYKGKKYVLDPEDLQKIIDEGLALKKHLQGLRGVASDLNLAV